MGNDMCAGKRICTPDGDDSGAGTQPRKAPTEAQQARQRREANMSQADQAQLKQARLDAFKKMAQSELASVFRSENDKGLQDTYRRGSSSSASSPRATARKAPKNSGAADPISSGGP